MLKRFFRLADVLFEVFGGLRQTYCEPTRDLNYLAVLNLQSLRPSFKRVEATREQAEVSFELFEFFVGDIGVALVDAVVEFGDRQSRNRHHMGLDQLREIDQRDPQFFLSSL